MAIKPGEFVRLQPPLGINRDAVPIALPPNDSPGLENVRLDKGSIRVRLGENGYINKAYQNLSAGIRSMARYRTESGTKKVVVSSGLFVYADSNDGKFDLLGAVAQNGEGYIKFEQYRDSLGMFCETANPSWYNAAAPTSIITPTFLPIRFANVGFIALVNTPSATGGFLQDAFYRWRVTFNVAQGGDFLGETSSAGQYVTASTVYWHYEEIDFTTFVGHANTSKVSFLRPSDVVVDAIPSYVSRINFYRSPAYSTAPQDLTPWLTEDTDLYRIGSVDITTVRGASANDVIFVDDGSIKLGPETPQISYGIRFHPIRPRYTAFHKGYLWSTYCNVAPNASSAAYVLDVDGVYYSRYYTNGIEPSISQTASPKIDLDPYSGEGNTGLVSWRNKVLIAFKPRSTHAIVGADDNISATIPNIQREILSPSVGCIAPHTIVQAEGSIIWMSHRGPEIFDGTGPRPLNSDKIRPFLDSIPATRRRHMTAYYDSKDREYVVFWTSPSDLTTNRLSFVYSFVTKEWTINRYQRGVGCALEMNETDQNRLLLFGYDDLATYFNTFDNDPIIVRGKVQFQNGLEPQTPISWSMEYNPYHFGFPVLSKTVSAIRLEGQWSDEVKVAFRVYGKNGVVDTTATPMTIPALPGGKGTTEEIPIKLQQAISGTHIGVVLSGNTSTAQTDIANVLLRIVPVGEA